MYFLSVLASGLPARREYGVIGNMKSIALVGMNGSIDFLCYPDVDSPKVFAGLLDEEQGGRCQIEPQLTDTRIRQVNLPDTNILLTGFLAEEGVAELTDFMPSEKDTGQPNEIVRIVTVIRGRVPLQCIANQDLNLRRQRTEQTNRSQRALFGATPTACLTWVM